MNKKIYIIFLVALAAGTTLSANPYFILGYVHSSNGTPGSLTTANSYAGVTLLRHQLMGQPAVQLAGPDPNYSTRIFPAQNGKASYYATDAGSQWTNPAGAGFAG